MLNERVNVVPEIWILYTYLSACIKKIIIIIISMKSGPKDQILVRTYLLTS